MGDSDCEIEEIRTKLAPNGTKDKIRTRVATAMFLSSPYVRIAENTERC